MTNYSELINKLERLIKTPSYTMLGAISDRLIYYSNVENTIRIWSANLDGTDKRPVSGERITAIAPPKPEHKYLIYGRDVTKGEELTQVYISDPYGSFEENAFEMKPTRIIGLDAHGDEVVYSGSSAKGVALFRSKIGGKAEELYVASAMMFVTSFNGKYIFGFGKLHGNPRSFEIFRFDVRNGEFKIFTPKAGSINYAAFEHEDKVIFRSDYEGFDGLYIMDSEEMKPSLLKPKESVKPLEYLSYGWTYDGEIYYTVNTKNGYRTFVGEEEIKYEGGIVSNVFRYKGRTFINYTSFIQPPSIYEYSESSFKPLIESKVDEDLIRMFKKVEHVWIKSFDGLEIPTFIIESKSLKPGPTVVYVHGGPWSFVADAWNNLIGSLVISGFHVVAPNFRGSTGYGTWFMKLDIGDPGGGDLEDVEAATKYAKEKGLAKKIAILGYSYGGFMTFLATVKKPDSWDAGVAGAGDVDWELSYELSDSYFKYFTEVLFDNNKDLMKDRSAIHFVDNLKVPLCIIHPEYDTRVPLKPVLNYVQKLLDKGKPFELHVIPEMGHYISKVDDLMKIVLPAILFLKEKLA